MATDRLPFTGNDEADRLLVASPMALLIGFTLDQQVPVPKAFTGPLELQRRIGTLDPAAIAAKSEEELVAAFSERPALHRFPRNMAKRVHELSRFILDKYDGKPERIWTEAKDGPDLEKRISAIPGFGGMKTKSLIAVLGKQLGAAPKGWEEVAPNFPTLGDVDSPEKLSEYQEWKRTAKAAAQQSGKEFQPWADPKQAEAYVRISKGE